MIWEFKVDGEIIQTGEFIEQASFFGHDPSAQFTQESLDAGNHVVEWCLTNDSGNSIQLGSGTGSFKVKVLAVFLAEGGSGFDLSSIDDLETRLELIEGLGLDTLAADQQTQNDLISGLQTSLNELAANGATAEEIGTLQGLFDSLQAQIGEVEDGENLGSQIVALEEQIASIPTSSGATGAEVIAVKANPDGSLTLTHANGTITKTSRLTSGTTVAAANGANTAKKKSNNSSDSKSKTSSDQDEDKDSNSGDDDRDYDLVDVVLGVGGGATGMALTRNALRHNNLDGDVDFVSSAAVDGVVYESSPKVLTTGLSSSEPVFIGTTTKSSPDQPNDGGTPGTGQPVSDVVKLPPSNE